MTNTLQALGEKRKILNDTYDNYIVDLIEGKPLDLSQETMHHMQRELFTLEQEIFTMTGNQTINSFEKE